MNQYVTGAIIKRLREERHLTQQELAERVCVSDKAVSKWETGRGYPDITLLEPLAAALGISVIELLAGEDVRNTNRGFNMRKARFYVCPICGNVICGTGEAVVSCCGVTLPPSDAEPMDEAHSLRIERVEDELYVTVDHAMTKEHYITFIAAVRDDGIELVRLYPEGEAATRLRVRSLREIFFCCNRDGLFRVRLKRNRDGSVEIRE